MHTLEALPTAALLQLPQGTTSVKLASQTKTVYIKESTIRAFCAEKKMKKSTILCHRIKSEHITTN